MLHRDEAAEDARAAATFKRTTEAKTLVKTFKRVCMEPSSQSGLPIELWSAILSKLIDPELWDLSGFVRDICNAGTHFAVVHLSKRLRHRHSGEGPAQAW